MREILSPAFRRLVLWASLGAALGLGGLWIASQASPGRIQKEPARFAWPEGKKAAVSLTFDDARPSQVDNGLAILNRHHLKATFYLSPDNLAERLDGWKQALQEGHEVGNHTLTHPCTGNYVFSRGNALEDYDLDRMAGELDGANALIVRLLGVKPRSFAYPCGQSFVGRGRAVRSYVPLVAARFTTGRGWLGEDANDPAVCDLVQLMGMESDGRDFTSLQALVDAAAEQGRWLILCGHEIGGGGYQTTRSDALERLCVYLQDPANGLWADTVSRIADYILSQRRQ